MGYLFNCDINDIANQQKYVNVCLLRAFMEGGLEGGSALSEGIIIICNNYQSGRDIRLLNLGLYVGG